LLFRRRDAESDLDTEVQSYFEILVAREVQNGVPLEEARRLIRVRFEAPERVKEKVREAHTGAGAASVVRDVKYAVRQLSRNPGFTVVVIFTLALGVGATTAIFSVVNGVILKPLPYPDSERLVEVKLSLPDATNPNWGLSRADYFVFREQNRTFQDIGLYTVGTNSAVDSVNVTGLGQPEHVPAQSITASVLSILGVTPLLGRSFTQVDDETSSANTVMLTYGYWRNKFGGDRSVLGKTLDIDGTPRVIIGVLPRQFSFLDKTKLAMLLPMKLSRAETQLGDYDLGAIARLKPGASLEQANADIARMIPIIFRTFPAPSGAAVQDFENLRLIPNIHPLKQEVVGDIAKTLSVLMGGIGLVLLIACANVANLLLLRTDGRQQELAIRSALGASRSRIAAALFCESLILGVVGGLLGLGLAYGAVQILIATDPVGLPRIHEIGIDGKIMMFTLFVSLATSFLFGCVPVFKYAGPGIAIRLREGGRSLSESRDRHRSRGVLVIVQVALALVLLIGSGLMMRTFYALTKVSPGFTGPSEIQTFRVYIPDSQIKDSVQVSQIEEAMSNKLQDLPGVSSVGMSADLPMDGGADLEGVFVRDRVYSSNETPLCRYDYVAPGFLKTLGTPLVAGREFTWSEIYNKVPVAMVSEQFARDYWHDPSSAIGKQIGGGPKSPWREVVGVVGDLHQNGVDKEAPASVYLPVLASFFGGDYVSRDVAFIIRSPRAGSEGLMSEVQRAVWSVDSSLPLADVYTLDYYYTKSMARTSFMLVMLSLAGAMALLLGIVGLYGVIAYSVSQRTHELGIRMALGAQKRDVLELVLVQGMSLTLIGMSIGIAAAFALTHFLSSLLYGVKPTDPLTFGAVSFILACAALLACYFPAKRAAKVDPIVALRYE
jgi:predicted permease